MAAFIFVISIWQFFVNLFPKNITVKGPTKLEKKQDYSRALRMSLTKRLTKAESAKQPDSTLKYIHTH